MLPICVLCVPIYDYDIMKSLRLNVFLRTFSLPGPNFEVIPLAAHYVILDPPSDHRASWPPMIPRTRTFPDARTRRTRGPEFSTV